MSFNVRRSLRPGKRAKIIWRCGMNQKDDLDHAEQLFLGTGKENFVKGVEENE